MNLEQQLALLYRLAHRGVRRDLADQVELDGLCRAGIDVMVDDALQLTAHGARLPRRVVWLTTRRSTPRCCCVAGTLTVA